MSLKFKYSPTNYNNVYNDESEYIKEIREKLQRKYPGKVITDDMVKAFEYIMLYEIYLNQLGIGTKLQGITDEKLDKVFRDPRVK